MHRPLPLLIALLLLALSAPGAQAIRAAALPGTVAGNTANRLAALTPDPEQYDRATTAASAPNPA